MEQVFDVAIIGGGINGCGCAADAALRGLSVILFEKDDIGSKTSSNSTKLIHGGLRYLEHYEFALVKKALDERQILLQLAPHLIHGQSLLLPHEKHMRPTWLLRLGLFIYDNLSRKNRLPKSQSVSRVLNSSFFIPLKQSLTKGFIFYDAITDDSRLTLANALQAKNHGAQIHNYANVVEVRSEDNIWILKIQPTNGEAFSVRAKSIINSAGPWVSSIIDLMQTPTQQEVSLVKGSHIVVPKLYEGDHGYFLQHEDNRVIFVLPYHGLSMIGTTDIPFTDNPDQVHISEGEVDYLLQLVNLYFNNQLTPQDVLHSWSGVRPLLADKTKNAQRLSRDYSYEWQNLPAPTITIFGGKITTYRQLAQDVVNQLVKVFPLLASSNTANARLPGAEFETMDFIHYVDYANKKYDWLDKSLLERYIKTYGCRTEIILCGCFDKESLGKHYGASLYQVELDYLMKEEWAVKSDDILQRRTKLGLVMDQSSREQLESYLSSLETSISVT